MDITASDAHGVLVAALTGRLDLTSAPAAEAALLGMVAKRQPVLIDLSGLAYASSAGLRVLLKAAREAKQTGHGLALCNAQGPVKEVLEISGFPSMIPLHATRDEALAALRGQG